jgi:hypothetical protein
MAGGACEGRIEGRTHGRINQQTVSAPRNHLPTASRPHTPRMGRPLCALLGRTGPIRGSPEADIGEPHRQQFYSAAISQVFLALVQNDSRNRSEFSFARALLKHVLRIGVARLPTLTNA